MMIEGAAVRTAAGEPVRAPARAGTAAWWRFAPALVVVAGLVAGYGLGLHHYLSLDFLASSRDALKGWTGRAPLLAPLAFLLLYALAVAFSFPAASVLTIFSGFLFGWFWGGLVAILAATLGATALFLAARTAFGGFLQARVGSWGAKLADGFRRDAFGYLLVLRFAPFIPFFAVNIAPALFNVRLRTFVPATFFGIMPAAFAYAWLGAGVDSVLQAARAAGRAPRVADLVTPEITIAFVLLALVAALAALVKRAWAGRERRAA